MNLRDEIMDKYWLDYLKYETSTFGNNPCSSRFWPWFYENIYKEVPKPLKDFL